MDTGRRTATEFGALEAFFPAVLALDGDLDRARRLEDSAFAMWTLSGSSPTLLDYRAMKPGRRDGVSAPARDRRVRVSTSTR